MERQWICPTTVFYKCKESRFRMHIKWLKTTESLKIFILFCWNNSMSVLLFKSAFLSCSHLLKVFQTACWLVAVKIKYKLSVGYINNVSQTVMPALQLSLGMLLWYVLVVVVKPHVKCMCNSVLQCSFYAGLRGSCQSGKFGYIITLMCLGFQSIVSRFVRIIWNADENSSSRHIQLLNIYIFYFQ